MPTNKVYSYNHKVPELIAELVQADKEDRIDYGALSDSESDFMFILNQLEENGHSIQNFLYSIKSKITKP